MFTLRVVSLRVVSLRVVSPDVRRLIALAWTVGLFAATLAPGEYVPDVPILSFDKLVHIALFFGFALLWLGLYPTHRRDVFLGGLAVGVAIEVLQHTLPIGRSGDVYDAVADALGLALAIAVHSARRHGVNRRSRPVTHPDAQA